MSTVRRFRITINGKVYDVEAEEMGQEVKDPAPAVSAGRTETAAVRKDPAPQTLSGSKKAESANPVGGSSVDAPLPGLVLDVKVSEGQAVDAGQVLVILEAMKMENEIVAPDSGTVAQVRVAKGDSVSAGDVLVVLS